MWRALCAALLLLTVCVSCSSSMSEQNRDTKSASGEMVFHGQEASSLTRSRSEGSAGSAFSGSTLFNLFSSFFWCWQFAFSHNLSHDHHQINMHEHYGRFSNVHYFSFASYTNVHLLRRMSEGEVSIPHLSSSYSACTLNKLASIFEQSHNHSSVEEAAANY